MGDKTKIEWTDATWNPVTGCTNPDRLDQPLHWKKPRRIFVNSMSDLFHKDVPDIFIDSVFAVMAQAHQHTYQILTKRPERALTYIDWFDGDINRCDYVGEQLAEKWGITATGNPDCDSEDYFYLPWPLPNVWLGVSVEDQETADERIPILLQTPAAVRFVSYEPALGPLTFNGPSGSGKIDWVIAGAESGPHARPSHPDWFRSVRDQCQAAGVPFFFKQWGDFLPYTRLFNESGCDHGISSTGAEGPVATLRRPVEIWECDVCGVLHDNEGIDFLPVGKKRAGRLLDGREWSEFPNDNLR